MARVYMQGEVWTYKTRPHEPNSRVFIVSVDRQENGDEIFHIALDGLQFKNPAAPGGFATEINHLPISRLSLADSVTEKLQFFGEMPDNGKGREMWLEAFKRGEAGVFPLPIADVITIMEKAVNEHIANSALTRSDTG